MKFGRCKFRTEMYVPMLLLMFIADVKSQAAIGFFNQSSVAYLSTSWDLQQTLGFSFRTCSVNGELLFQSGASGDFLKLRLASGSLEFQFKVNSIESSISIGSNLANNLWYNIEMNRIMGVNNLKISQASSTLYTKVLANSTYNQQLLSVNVASGTNLTVGQTFVGCLNEGRGVMLSLASRSVGVLWGQCPLQQQAGCSSGDTNPCAANPCENNGECIVEAQSYRCRCPVIYNGTHCENYIGNLGCAIQPCQNNAACSPRTPNTTNRLTFHCECSGGFTGTYCETDIDECLLTAQACLNGGRCVDGINQYSCNCSGTGYGGPDCSVEIDECLSFLCGEGGTCINRPGSFECACPEGYFGEPCQRILACNSSPCQHGGACQNVGASYKCACSLGYTGTDCETIVNKCVNVTCSGEHVICESEVTSHRCICEAGYAGLPGSCEDINECATQPCLNDGTCMNLINEYKCVCPLGFNGTNCETNINECANNPCQDRGSCTDGLGNFTCNCDGGYTGKTCDVNIDECLTAAVYPCQNGGTCDDQIGGYTCSCIPGYTGYNCDTDINECDAQPCINGTCRNLLNDYTCDCMVGFTGSDCSVNINDCSPNPCQNNGFCKDGVNNFTCNCTTQWMGTTCSEQYDACSFAPCKYGATCSSTLGSRDYTCACVSGYTGVNCDSSIDDCEDVICPPFQMCFDGLNDYTCDCPTGFSGPNCSVNVNECADAPCTNNGTCHDGLGSYTCQCQGSMVNLTRFMRPGESLVFQTGYTGQRCEQDINECQIVPSICLNDGQCQNSNGSYGCLCPNRNGVLYTGTNCELTTDYCLLSEEVKRDPPACKNNGTCRAKTGNYSCDCAPGFEGRRCEINIQECDVVRNTENREPCGYNGTCHDGINEYICECIPGITGPTCGVNIDDCKPDPCRNGGRCKDDINMYTCNCLDTGFEGENCTEDIDDCLGNPCLNGASCDDKIKDYNCSCFDGFTGKNCETDINECVENPCQNDGTCFQRSLSLYYPDNPIPGNFSYDAAGGYYCRCKPGFNGSSCENNIDECLEVTEPCLNGGTCNDGVNSYSCSCADGFHGDRCENEINECLVHHPCRNGATCRDRVADYFCQCLPSLNRVVYGGKNCTTVLTGCQGNLCQNGATCMPVLVNEEQSIHNYTCNCPPGWDGNYCQSDTSASFWGSSFIYQQGPVRNFTQRFRTTVQDGVVNLLGSTNQNFLTVELQAGKLCVQGNSAVSCLAMPLNDGLWHGMGLQLNANSVSLSIDDDSLCAEQTCSASLNNGADLEDVTFGGIGMFNDVTETTLSKKNFIGCLEDMEIDDSISVSPTRPNSEVSGVTVGCGRQEQCLQNTCNGRGTCTDLWFSASCECDRPYYGLACEAEIPPVTFSPGNQVSLVSFNPPASQSQALETKMKLSLFFTTRTPDGVIFFMGGQLEAPPTGEQCINNCNYFLLRMKDGHLCIKYSVCTSRDVEYCSPQGITYNDGQTHFLQADRKLTELSVLVDGISLFGTLRLIEAGLLCRVKSDHFYFGSLPNLSARRRKRQTMNPSIYTNMTNFKGVIQDARVNGDLLLFYQLNGSGLPESFPLPNGTATTQIGVVNDDVCGTTNPCKNNATCENMFYNDYNCSCPEGFAGKSCDFEDRCLTSPCPGNSTCHSLQGGYECVTSATFRPGHNSLQYSQMSGQSSDVNSITMRLRTREQSGVMMSLRNELQQSVYAILELADGTVQLLYNMGSETKNLTSVVVVNDGVWHDVSVQQLPGHIQLFVDGQVKTVDDNTVQTFATLISINTSELFVGAENGVSNTFIGCLDEIRINKILLPFYSNAELQIPTSNNLSQRFSLISQDIHVTKGCNSEPVCEVDAPVCNNGGTCHDLWNYFWCDCALGYEGDTCSDNVDDCLNHECQNGASCEDGLNNITCLCVPGFYGWRCEAQTNECQNLPCLNGGLCIDEVNDFSCNCTSNYTGKVCDILITETCDRMPCQNGATCQDYNETISGQEVARFNCTCAPGYEGQICDQEIDYCADFPCSYGATCISNVTLLDYICVCTPGYTDKNCSTEINECDSGPCKNGATCNDFINAYNCSCASGWQGFNCDEDILECNQTVNPCGDHGECIELPGDFECDCEPGFEGKPCEDINECDIGQCKNGADCENTIGDYFCNCSLGYEGKDCDMPNCSHSQCLMNSTCEIVQSTNTWRCNCLEYYEGKQCEIRGPCVSVPCQNGATCFQDVEFMNYTCECLPGFKGDNCEEDRNECEEDNPCQNNGTCHNTIGSYYCECPIGFTGDNCETNINDCEPNPCENGGQCTDLVNGFECDCTDTGYEGLTCTEDINECVISAPCQHGATCINEPGGFVCKCVEGYEGELCEIAKAVGVTPDKIGIIIGSIVGFLILIAIICLIVFIVLARNKRATRGTYSPSRQEMSGSRVELGQVIKPPPEERLI